MKLSFSLSSKQSSKPQSNVKPLQPFNTDDQDDKSSVVKTEFVTEFDPSKSIVDSKKLVIPPKPNEWRPHKKMRNLDLPVKSDDPNLQFEVESTSHVDPTDSSISYGLNLRQSNNKDGDLHPKTESNDRQFQKPDSIDGQMLKKLREDLDKLPEDRGFEEFNDVPVEGFGAALLAGYGWFEGRGIGKNAKEDVKVVEYKRWTAKEGLGFVAMPPPKSTNGSNGVVHKKKGIEEETNAVGGGSFTVGKDVRVIGGRHMGLKGRIIEVTGGGDPLVLRLSRSEEEVTVRIRDVAELGSMEEERCLKKLKELKIRESKVESGKNSSKSASQRDEANQDRKKDSKRRSRGGGDKREELLKSSSKVSWLISHIRVRIISKELKGGKLYLKKGKIVDVVGPMKCDISMDESRELVQGVDQEFLETALPRRGGPVIVLYGRHKGVYGSLVEKDVEKEIGVVQDADTHSLLNVRLEQIAEYIGDPSSIEY
ncbi:hypothetical protein LguiB_028210 [Lonicera macranthoides]